MERAADTPLRRYVNWALVCVQTVLLITAGYFIYRARQSGLLMNILNLILIGAAFGAVLLALYQFLSGYVQWSFWRAPFTPENRSGWLQILPRWIFWGLFLTVVNIALIPQIMPGGLLVFILILLGGSGIVLLLISSVPKSRLLHWPMTIAAIVGSVFLASLLAQIWRAPELGEAVAIQTPVAEEAFVFQGGGHTLINHHYPITAQRYALDLTVLNASGKIPMPAPATDMNDDACFGASLSAPVSGTVVRARGDRPDQAYGTADGELLVGNHVVIEMVPEVFVLLAHLKQDSVLVEVGDNVEAGQPIGQCGNSGNTSAPHLHLQVQTRADWDAPDQRALPMAFIDATRIRGGRETDGPFTARRKDRIVPRP